MSRILHLSRHFQTVWVSKLGPFTVFNVALCTNWKVPGTPWKTCSVEKSVGRSLVALHGMKCLEIANSTCLQCDFSLLRQTRLVRIVLAH